jgi:uncharacterized protein
MAEIDSGLVLEDWQKEWAENAANPAPLHPKLAEYLERATPDSKLGWDTLKHPLVFGVPYTPAMNFFYNRQYEAKMAAVKQALAAEDWSHFIAMHERPYRFDAFEAICDKLDGATYWDLLSFIWSDSENLYQIGYKRLKRFLSLHPEHRDHFMDDHEKRLLAKLPDQIRVFRGHQNKNQRGFSWTLAYNTAVWFGRRLCEVGHGKVSEGLVRKSDIVGLVLGRNEMEVVVDYRHVRDLRPMRLVERSEPLEGLRQELLRRFKLHGRTDHGPDHWDRVDCNAVKLCRLVPDADEVVVRLFAIFHDSQRQDEHSDPKHGHRAADLVTRMYKDGGILGITEEQFRKLEWACRHHNGHGPVSDPTIGICFDSDHLDLLRVGIVPNPKLLSIQAARDLIGVI